MGLEIRSEVLADASSFARLWSAIDQLRHDVGASEVLLNPLHFLTTTDEQRRSCSVAVWRGKDLIGLLYATQHYVKGIPTGYAVGGDFSGRGLLVCSPHEERLVLGECIRRLSRDGVHALHLRLLPRDERGPTGFSAVLAPISGLKIKVLDAVIPGDLLRLRPDFEDLLATLGKHTRRNIRACIRKTEQAGIEFAANLSKEEYDRAVERLNAETDFPADSRRLSRDERLLTLHDGERMGLRSADGTIIAVLCGFRRGDRFHLMTQLNDVHYERLSLSLVLRAYTCKYLIENGLASLHFLGGSSLSFGRYCEPEQYRSIFVDRSTGVAAAAKKLFSLAVRLMVRMRKRVPEALAMLCGGNLSEALLADRTVLRPAAMLLSQRSGATRQQDQRSTEPEAARHPLLRESA